MKKTIDNLKNSRRVLRSFSEVGLFRLIALLALFSLVNIFPMRMTEQGKALAQRHLARQQQEKWEQQEELRETRKLLILLDDSEKDLTGAIGNSLVTALFLEKYPIIASASLLYNVREEAKKDTRPIEDLLNDMLIADIENKEEYKKKNRIVASRKIPIEDWIIKKINNSLVLLIPKSCLEQLSIGNDQVEHYNKNLELPSEVELKLGLKINHMETITIEQIVKTKESLFADYFVEAMNFIFCTKSDYRIAKLNSYEWVVYIHGHGAINAMVTGLRLNDFQQFLTFLENKIKTRLLMYESCFAVGVNSDKIFGNMKSLVKAQYSFPIIMQGVNDAAATVTDPTININSWRENKEINFDVNPHYFNFFTMAKQIKEGKFKNLFYSETLFNIPQIKLPGIEWLSVDIVKDSIVSIGSILVKTHDPQKPLDIVSFFKKDPKIILLYADDIPFELVINSNKLKTIFFMKSPGWNHRFYRPGFMIHRIKKISSTTHDFVGILRWFIFAGLMYEYKWFFVDEISDNKDILIFGTNEGNARFYYKDHNNDLFMAEVKKVSGIGDPTEVPILFNKVNKGSDEEKDYNQRMFTVRYRYPFGRYIYPWLSGEATTEISPEQIKNIENIYPEQRGKQEYEEIESFYPEYPSWLRSWLKWW
jgi:hypothetical protein